MDNKSFTIRVPKRWVRISMIVGVTALIVAPLTAMATHTFNDVPNNHTFHADIEWLEASGVTKGCNPPLNDRFCPDDNVTRGQMAAFMERFAGYLGAKDGTPAQADNATTADTALEVSNDVAGVALAGVQFGPDGTVLNWFNRFSGPPTVTNTGTGAYTIAFPGLEGKLGPRALVMATDLEGGPNLIRHFNSGSNNVVTLRVYDLDGNLENSHVNMTVMASNESAVLGASDVGGEDANE